MEIDVADDIDLYESDIQRIKAVGIALKAKEGTWSEPEPFAIEIAERFAEAGYRADVMLGVSETAGVNDYRFYVRIIGRIDPGSAGTEFDHERMAREVRAAQGVDPGGLKEDLSKISQGPRPR
jgi:hypothetical protein